jgi:hypothetical protein
MQGEDMRSPAEQGRDMGAAVMGLLLDPRFHIWRISEVEKEIGDPVAVRDSLNRLRGAGLVHELHYLEFVMPTRAALAADELPQ